MLLINRFRLLLVVAFLILGFLLHARIGIEAAWMLYASAIILLILHFLFGNVWLAFRSLQRGKADLAQRLLRQTRFPHLLVRRNRAYYYFTQGMLDLQREELEAGNQHLEQALELGLYRANDRALAHLNLAHIAYVQQQYERASQQSRIARAAEPTDLLIKDQLNKLERALAELS